MFIALAALSLITVILVAMYQIKNKQAGNQQAADERERLQPLIQLPNFMLTDQHGNAFNARQLQGKVWIADFVFTRCQGPCPMLTMQMAKLELKLKKDPRWNQMRLMSFSVDPEYDTPKVLTEHSSRVGQQTKQWIWLTGGRKHMWDIINNGFKLAGGPTAMVTDDPGHGLINHSTKFVLVDRKLRVRSYYDGMDAQDTKRLLEDIQTILDEKQD